MSTLFSHETDLKMLILIIISCCTLFTTNSSSISFGIQELSSNKSVYTETTSSTITLTLYWNAFKYQCTIYPTHDINNTYYSCSTSDVTNTKQCIPNPSKQIKYGLQIDTANYSTLKIDRIIINDNINTYNIEYFCFNQSSTKIMDIFGVNDNENCLDILPIANNATFQHNLIIFGNTNTSKSNIQNIDEAAQCQICLNTMQTPYYGGSGGQRYSAVNQGKIIGISSWGIQIDDKILGNLQWMDSSNIAIGDNQNDIKICDPFILDADDYINGYRVISDENVRGLIFYTLHNLSYECIDSAMALDIDNYQDSGIVRYNEHYLTGFYWYSADEINSISFQFTPFDNSNLCEYKYILVESKMSWEDANDFCLNEYNSSLATIITDNDMQIASYIQQNIHQHSWEQKQNLWIGLTDKYSETIWEWSDGTSCNYTNTAFCVNDHHWQHNMPNDKNGKHCGFLHGDGLFNDGYCDNQQMFLCNNDPLNTVNDKSGVTYSPLSPSTDLNKIIIGICILIGCCTIAAIIGVALCCCIYVRENKIKNTKYQMEQQQIPHKDDEHTVELPKIKKIDIENIHIADSENIQQADTEDTRLETPNSLKVHPQLSDVYTLTPSGVTMDNSIPLPMELSHDTISTTLNIEGVQHHEDNPKLDVIYSASECEVASPNIVEMQPLSLKKNNNTNSEDIYEQHDEINDHEICTVQIGEKQEY